MNYTFISLVWRANRSDLLRASILLVAILSIPFAGVLAADRSETSARPNVLFIISDDLNMSLGCYGHPLAKSPHIDRLAARGMRFDRAYCQASVCNPTRASIYSGLLPETIGVMDNSMPWPRRPASSQYMPAYFRSHGYLTGTIGKVLDHGRVSHQPFWDMEIREWGKHPPKSQIDERDEFPTRISYWAKLNAPDKATGDGDVARRAAAALALWSGQDKPFFLAVGFRRPHAPYAAPSRYFDLYPLEKITLPESKPEQLRAILPVANSGYLGNSYDRALAKHALRGYYASISFMDAQVGVVMQAMDRHRLWDKTIVVFVSDHGYHTGHHGMWHKETLFEQSARVPMIVVAPGRRGSAVCRRLVELVDLYPTLAELCGLPAQKALEGKSIVALLDDPNRTWKHPARTMVARMSKKKKRTALGRSVRTERFRYTEWDEGKQGIELYDHARDPNELVNLAQDPAHTATLARLRQILRRRSAS